MKRNLFFILLLASSITTYSQKYFDNYLKGEYDSTFYDNFANTFTLKFYSTRSFSSYDLNDQKISKDLNYQINSVHSYGLGFSYKWLGINAGYAFPFLNKDDTLYGKTRMFDFSTQVYLQKSTFSFYYKSSKGFYLENSFESLNQWPENDLYVRPDLKELTLGLGGNYLFNNGKYSNRATYLQSEWQKKSAGSFVLGGTMLVHQIKADSSIVPSQIKYTDFFRGYSFSKTKYFSLTTEFGYAYTFVFFKHWYLNAMVATGLGFGNSKIYIDDGSTKKKNGINMALASNFGAGYNSSRFFAGLNYSTLNSNSPTAIQSCIIGAGLSKFRLVVAYRFQVGPDFKLLPNWLPIPDWIPHI